MRNFARAAALLSSCGLFIGAVAAEPAPTRSFDLQGHRGARGLAPENTMAAFRRAQAIGVTTLETDVAITRDSVPILSHDPFLNPALVRDARGAWLRAPGPPISSLSFEQIQTYEIGRLDPQSDYARSFPAQVPVDGERFPKLADVLRLIQEDGALRANVETKITPGDEGHTADVATFVRLIVDEIRTLGLQDRVTIQSFDWRSLLEARRIAPEIATVCLTIDSKQMNTMAAGPDGASPWHAGLKLSEHEGSVPALVKAAGCSTWSPLQANLTPAAIADAHRRGLKVVAWTVNEPADMERLIDAGVDGLITDYPDRLRAAMQRKGLPLP